MSKNSIIPRGYMTVGKLAKKMGVTVRTLQYYDKEGLLSPSAESEGGFRLYSDKDVVKLHQIQSMKYLGFSLDDIRNRLVSLDSPEQVAAALAEQAETTRAKLSALTESLRAIEALREEVLLIKSVDFKKYADIVASLQAGHETYWAVKDFSDKLLTHVKNRFDGESSRVFVKQNKKILREAKEFKAKKIPPDSEKGLSLGKRWVELLLSFMEGDASLLPELIKFGESNKDNWDADYKKMWEEAEEYLNAVTGAYIETIGYNPLVPKQEENT